MMMPVAGPGLALGPICRGACGVPAGGGALFVLGTASVSSLGYEHDIGEPVVRAWNG